jgi:ribosome recycling factor
MIDDVLSELKSSGEKAIEAFKRELSKLRTGRAHPSILDGIRVDYYGQVTPLGQMATISVPEPRLLTVKAWDKSQVHAIEKALRESDLGLNPQVDSELIRIPIPPLSEERRKDMVKLAKKQAEECRVAIRHARHEGLDMLEELKQAGSSEDEVERGKKKAEEVVVELNKAVDHTLQHKEKEILTV